MKISLNHKVFTTDPYKAFAERHKTAHNVWYEMYNKRYLWHGYEVSVLTEYFNLVTKKQLTERTIRRWIKRTELYNHAQRAIKMGVREVTPSYFDRYVTRQELEEILK